VTETDGNWYKDAPVWPYKCTSASVDSHQAVFRNFQDAVKVGNGEFAGGTD